MTIRQIQALLTYLGYNPGTVDGINGPNTTAAVLAFQQQESLERDGKPGPATQKALLAAVAAGRMYKPTTEEKPSSGQPPDSTGTFWDKIKYFRREEFRCKCGGRYCNGFPVEMQEKLIRIADALREEAGVSITVSSGIRCKQHNANVGGVSNSRHLLGKAMDFHIQGWPSSKTLAAVKKHPEIRYTYAIDGSYVHMDIP